MTSCCLTKHCTLKIREILLRALKTRFHYHPISRLGKLRHRGLGNLFTSNDASPCVLTPEHKGGNLGDWTKTNVPTGQLEVLRGASLRNTQKHPTRKKKTQRERDSFKHPPSTEGLMPYHGDASQVWQCPSPLPD